MQGPEEVASNEGAWDKPACFRLSCGCLIGGLVIWGLLSLWVDHEAKEFVRTVRQNHIDANVPPEEIFDECLARCLTEWCDATYDNYPPMKYELLRKGPTQVGMGWTYYYAWAVVTLHDGSVVNHVLKLVALHRSRFRVFGVMTCEEIRAKGLGHLVATGLREEVLRRCAD